MTIALSLLVLTTLALAAGAVFLWRREGYRRQAALMLVLALVLAANVAIWTVPVRSGASLAQGAPGPETAKAPQ
ncbi:hypothetical protein MTR62_00685 [Novosphingobium sp. 1949]|uniref:Uncharacterized protein n=1 Tax=Novosphingobium organovorum TaxID=2930092 RepID=A0ABT0B8N8_9SPHN|nr:hypothetical protein [Novosphingobium organovorum]MCJ2181230.1 hypothetical protein [Novosphingobium organovorum]